LYVVLPEQRNWQGVPDVNQQDLIDACNDITAGYTPGGNKLLSYISGTGIVGWLIEQNIIRPNQSILDMGSGNGRLPMGICHHEVPVVSYIGVEIIKECVQFCNHAFAQRPEYRFFHSDVSNKRYWLGGKTDPEKYKLPFVDSNFDLIVCMSFFSHTGTLKVAQHYLSECMRVLKKDGMMLSTWYFTDTYNSAVYDTKKTVYFINHIYTFMERSGWMFKEVDHEGMYLAEQIPLLTTHEQ
jgi:SAM-dependent methyltransferase